MHLDGTICHATAKGTSLERFSDKPRLVLLAYHDDVHAFVYPLTTAKTKDAIKVTEGPATAWLVVRCGLFRLPLSSISETDRRWSQFGRLRERVKRDLATLEERYAQENSPLTQRGLETLEALRHELPPPEPIVKPAPVQRQMTDEELFLHYLDKFEKS